MTDTKQKSTSHLQRSLLVKKCIARHYSGEVILSLLDRINAFPEEERETQAEKITREIEREFPLIRNDTNYTK